MASRYQVSRIVHALESTVVEADSESEAIEKSRKLLRKEWKELDAKRRRGYRAVQVDINTNARTA